MRRREFISVLGGAATWPFAARAQQPGAMRRVSLLLGLADGPDAKTRVRAFQLGLRDLGWIEGRNVAIDYRYGSSDLGLINQYANEIVGLAPMLSLEIARRYLPRCSKPQAQFQLYLRL